MLKLEKGGGILSSKMAAMENLSESSTANVEKLCKWFKGLNTKVHFSKTSRYHLSLVFINYFRTRIIC